MILNWYYDEEDDTILEFGDGIHDDFTALDYRPVAVDLGRPCAEARLVIASGTSTSRPVIR